MHLSVKLDTHHDEFHSKIGDGVNSSSQNRTINFSFVYKTTQCCQVAVMWECFEQFPVSQTASRRNLIYSDVSEKYAELHDNRII